MAKPKVSFIPCGVHVGVTDTSNRPFIDYETLKKAAQSLREAELEVHEIEKIVRTRREALEAVHDAVKNDVDCIIFYAASWLWASELAQAADIASKPIIVWTPPISQGWATGGALVLHGTFDEIGLKHRLIYGFPYEQRTMAKIRSFAKAAMAIRKLRSTSVGLVGGPTMGIQFTGTVSQAELMKKFGVMIDHVDQHLIFHSVDKFSENSVNEKYEDLKKKLGQVLPLDQVTERSIRIYLALKELVEQRNFDAIALKCFPELGDYYSTACLAASLLGDEGIVTGCVGDLNTTLTAYILHLLTGEAVFNPDVQQIRVDEGVLKLVSDGACPLSFAKNLKQVSLSRRGVFGEGGADGVVVGLACKPGPVTLARLFRINGEYRLHIAVGNAFEPPEKKLEQELKECGFPQWPHAFIKLEGDAQAFIQNQRSEYISMSYGDLRHELLDLCYLLDIEPVESK